MRSFAIILHASITLALAKEEQSSMDELVDQIMDRLMGGIQQTDLDKTTLAKAHQDSALAKLPRVGSSPALTHGPAVFMSVPQMQAQLRTFGVAEAPMEKLALTALASTRDVSMKAQLKQVYAESDKVVKAEVSANSEKVVKAAAAFDRSNMAGIVPPTGFFDPLKISAGESDGFMYFAREMELKHGRVGMIASLGFFVSEKFHPWFGGDVNWESALASHHTGDLDAFWAVLLVAIGAIEVQDPLFKGEKPDFSVIPGDLGFDPLNMKPKDPKALLDMQNKELANGRLAMLAAAGMIAGELVKGSSLF